MQQYCHPSAPQAARAAGSGFPETSLTANAQGVLVSRSIRGRCNGSYSRAHERSHAEGEERQQALECVEEGRWFELLARRVCVNLPPLAPRPVTDPRYDVDDTGAKAANVEFRLARECTVTVRL